MSARLEILAAACALALVVLAAGACGRAPEPAPTPTPTATAGGAVRVPVTAREFLYEPKQFAVKPGETTFVVKNEGAIDHDFVIEDAKGKIVADAKPFPAGATVQVTARLTSGSYIIYCSIPGHREAGMEATLTVAP